MKNKLRKFVKKYFSSFAFFYRYLRNKIFVFLFLSVVTGVLDGLGLTMFFPLLQVVGDGGTVNSDEMGQLGFIVTGLERMGMTLNVVTVLSVMMLFFILKGIATYLQKAYKVFLTQSFMRRVRLNVLKLINQVSYKSFISADVGRIQNTMTGEVQKLNVAFVTYTGAMQLSLMVLVYLSFAFMASPQFAILVTIGGIITNVLYKIIYTKTKKASRALTHHDSIYQGEVIQHISHFRYLKATAGVNNHSEKLKKSISQIEQNRKKIGLLNAISASVREPILVTVVVIIMFTQIYFLEGKIEAIIISLIFFYRGLTSLLNLQEAWNGFMANTGALENIQDFQNELSESKDQDGKIPYKALKEGITIKEVDFSYDDSQILKKINLKISKNTSVAFVGESGSGKTTLISIITGLLPPINGEVYIDSQNLCNIKKETYQKRIGFVSQDPVIFNDTIFNNVTFWAEQSVENIARFNKALEQAAILEFVETLPEGKDTRLGHNGVNLSGGQRQRISIARELFKKIDILILDEATSALDSETENEIQTSIDALQGQYTILMIAHRLSTIKNADKIVFMNQGVIIDSGSFEDLLQRQERFKRMVELQEL